MKKHRVNESISAYRVKVIDENGQFKGEMIKSAALLIARQNNVDLVEVSPGTVPTCKMTDYGKMLYEQRKAEKHQKHSPVTKEIRIKYKTEAHDIEIKRKKANELLADGHKVVFVMKLEGREKNITGNAAKDRFISIVNDIFAEYKMSEVQDGGNNYRVTITPAKNETLS